MKGQVAFVTGASKGLGEACAKALAHRGARVYLVGRDRARLETVCARIRSQGGEAELLVCDITSAAAVREAVAGMPCIDILLNNAGSNIPEPFVDVSDAHLDAVLALNVRAAFVVAQAVTRKMLEDPQRKARGGAIINMSSQMGHVGAPNRTVYCMTKHAIEGLTKAMAVELAPWNIRVNAVAPTFVETPMTQPFFEKAEFRKWVLDRIPLERLGTVEDVAAAVEFLASGSAPLITGTSLVVDGGWTAQ